MNSTNKKIIKHLYEAKIFEKNSTNNDVYYYKNRFFEYEDALDQCNSVFFKMENKNNYEKKINLIPYK